VKRIDLEHWPRRGHYELFRTFEQPHYAVTVDVRCDGVRERARAAGAPLHMLVGHAITAAAAAVPALRQRLRPDGVVEHAALNPSMTVMGPGDVFAFCPMVFRDDLGAFVRDNAAAVQQAAAHPGVDVDHTDDARLFITAIPWFAFTSFTHPVRSRATDSVPLVAWGRIAQRDGGEWMPVNVQVHHALVDGVHLSEFFAGLETGLG
jgi:chloramphenicol O-acetyltransferase type A